MPKLLSKKLDLFRDISSSGLTENKKKGKKISVWDPLNLMQKNFQINFLPFISFFYKLDETSRGNEILFYLFFSTFQIWILKTKDFCL